MLEGPATPPHGARVPIIADVDGDGRAEILTNSDANSGLYWWGRTTTTGWALASPGIRMPTTS